VLAISCGSSHVLPGEPIPRVMGGALLLNGRRHLRRPHTQTTGAAGVSEAGTAAAGWPAGRLAGWLATLAGWLGGAHRLGDGFLAELDLLGAAVGGAPALHKVPEAPAGVAEPHGHTAQSHLRRFLKKEKGRGKRRLSKHDWDRRQKKKGTRGSVRTPSPTCDTVALSRKKRRASAEAACLRLGRYAVHMRSILSPDS
jgi:hypothetical protein